LILAFPDFEFSLLALFALVPLFFAIEREKDSVVKSFLTGWLFGMIFFFGTCWWLTFAPITYAGMPWLLVYFFMLCAASVVGILPGIFGALFSILLKRFGSYAILSAPFLWIFTEFLRMWLTGNNWNALGYSQAFAPTKIIQQASVGGVYMVGFSVVMLNILIFCLLNLKKIWAHLSKKQPELIKEGPSDKQRGYFVLICLGLFVSSIISGLFLSSHNTLSEPFSNSPVYVIAVQPNVPMSGLTYEKYQQVLAQHIRLAEKAFDLNLSKFVEAQMQSRSKSETFEESQKFYTEFFKKQFQDKPKIIIFPESPMIFQYGRDEDLQKFLRDFAVRNNASILFNSAEMTKDNKRALNSAVMINEKGEKIAQYDKIHLLPFGEYIPFPEPIASQMPAFVGNFEFGNEYDLLPIGDAKGGVMICFESHFGELSREYSRRGADVLIEMTNDGYLGNTPVLRQHLANSVFRAVETNRPLLRVTNVGVTAYINERGEISDAADVYTEASRVWTVSKSDGKQTIYVKYGDWFAWLCSLVSLALLFGSYFYKKSNLNTDSQK
ncbi:MAG: apolipoprotein N-acyltransferase, partial [Actinomycetota bacterium]